MEYSPADLLADYLVAQGFGVAVSEEDGVDTPPEWQVFVSGLSEEGDKAICIYDTDGALQKRLMRGGKWCEKFGIEIRVRSIDSPSGWAKLKEIVEHLDETVRRTVLMRQGFSMMLHNAKRTSAIMNLGEEETNRRSQFTVNYNLSLSEVPVSRSWESVLVDVERMTQVQLDSGVSHVEILL